MFLDPKMPRVDGMEVFGGSQGSSGTKRIPVIVMTSSQKEMDVLKSYDLGANRYIVKPIDFNKLAVAARNGGFYCIANNRLPSSG